jgi:hypothetical protein
MGPKSASFRKSDKNSQSLAKISKRAAGNVTSQTAPLPILFKNCSNGALGNVMGAKHYIGIGFNVRKKIWTEGMFLTDFELTLPEYERWAREADFIIHFKEVI